MLNEHAPSNFPTDEELNHFIEESQKRVEAEGRTAFQEQTERDRARFAASAQASKNAPLSTGIDKLRDTIQADFPNLWPYVDVALAVSSVLFLKDVADCASSIFVGASGSGKSTVVEMFYGYRRSYKSDDFTPAAFVTQAANLTEDERLKIDLLPRVKHKVLLVSECGTLFRGKAEARAELFKILTRVLDGVGYRRDAGTAGGRGYDGDYLWAWLGGTTEVSDDTWKIMSNLGSRLFFCRLPNGGTITADDLVNSAQRNEPYKVRLARCSSAVAKFMNDLDVRYGFRGKSWNLTEDDSRILKWIAQLSLLIATLRGMNRSDDDEEAECPYRAFNILVNVACGHALVHGRDRLTLADVVPVARLVVGSVPRGVSKLLVRLLTVGPFNKKEAQAIIRPRSGENLLRDNVKRAIDTLTDAGVIQWNGHQYCPTSDYAWSNPLNFKEIMAAGADFGSEAPL